MKRILFSILGLGLGLSTNAQLYKHYSFDILEDISPWNSSTDTSFTNPVNACEGERSFSKLFENGGPQEVFLTSPNYTSDGTDLNFSFSYKVMDYSPSVGGVSTNPTPNSNFKITFQYSTDSGATWNDKWETNDNTHTPTADCTLKEFTLTPSEVGNGNIRFRFKSERMAGDFYIYIDDVTIQQSATQPPCVSSIDFQSNKQNCGNLGGQITWADDNLSTSYDVTIGTTEGANDVFDGETIERKVNFDTMTDQEYFVTITPKNGLGTATGCETLTFTTSENQCHCLSNPASVDNDGITNISLPNQNFSFDQNNQVFYYDYMNTPIELEAGDNLPIDITFETGYDYDTHFWIDYNQNYVFDEDELVYSGQSLSTTPGVTPTVLNVNIAIPETTTPGLYVMRMGAADTGQATPNPCYNGDYGTTADFTVQVNPTTGTIVHNQVKMLVYPNPTKDFLTISNDSSIQTIQIFDVNGRRIWNQTINSLSTTIDMNSYATGTYFVKIFTEKEHATYQITKQ